jgi:hypothetical protein
MPSSRHEREVLLPAPVVAADLHLVDAHGAAVGAGDGGYEFSIPVANMNWDMAGPVARRGPRGAPRGRAWGSPTARLRPRR